MWDGLRNLDKKAIANIAAALVLGIVLLVMSGNLLKPKKSEKTAETSGSLPPAERSYENSLEKRMEEALSQIDGAGKVKVMLTLSYGREIVVAEDTATNDSVTKDTDAQGLGRTTQSSSVDAKKIIITGSDGESAPLILREAEPKIEGVIIIAEGGDNVYVKQALTSAAEAVLGLDIAKVQIFKMKP